MIKKRESRHRNWIITVTVAVALVMICIIYVMGGSLMAYFLSKHFIRDKYGFNAKVTNIEAQYEYDIIPFPRFWPHKSGCYIVCMEYENKKFEVYINLSRGTDSAEDSYQYEEICDAINQLIYDALGVAASYSVIEIGQTEYTGEWDVKWVHLVHEKYDGTNLSNILSPNDKQNKEHDYNIIRIYFDEPISFVQMEDKLDSYFWEQNKFPKTKIELYSCKDKISCEELISEDLCMDSELMINKGKWNSLYRKKWMDMEGCLVGFVTDGETNTFDGKLKYKCIDYYNMGFNNGVCFEKIKDKKDIPGALTDMYKVTYPSNKRGYMQNSLYICFEDSGFVFPEGSYFEYTYKLKGEDFIRESQSKNVAVSHINLHRNTNEIFFVVYAGESE